MKKRHRQPAPPRWSPLDDIQLISYTPHGYGHVPDGGYPGTIRYLTPAPKVLIFAHMNMTARQMTFRELLARFSDEDACKAFLAGKRWPDGVVKCPRCGGKAFTLKSRPFHYVCKSGAESLDQKTGELLVCSKNGYRFSVLTRTVFENTNIKLRDWFKVIFLMFHSKKGMSALQIHRMLGTGSYETAWFMCHRIRAAMRGDTFPLSGEIEADEPTLAAKTAIVTGMKRASSNAKLAPEPAISRLASSARLHARST
jgi:transposase-like protein